jgi:hypothetical protein
MVRTYSLAKDGNRQLSEHFKVKEFACRDGSDKILISEELIALLEKIRTHFNRPVTITSGYRTKLYNEICGGATKSQHLYGTAADIIVGGTDPLKVCRYAEMLMPRSGGIGWYIGSRFTHVDTRSTKARWKQQRSGMAQVSVSGFLPVLRKGAKGDDVKALQTALNEHGYKLKADGDFGTNTYNAVVDFQRKNRLTVDGVVGVNTWAALV